MCILKQMVRFLYILPVQNGDILFWKFGSHFFYINRVVLINLGRFYLCAFCFAVADPGFLKRGFIC